MKDGYTTGSGLGPRPVGRERLSNEFSIESRAGRRAPASRSSGGDERHGGIRRPRSQPDRRGAPRCARGSPSELGFSEERAGQVRSSSPSSPPTSPSTRRRRDPAPPDPRMSTATRAPTASRSWRSTRARGCRMWRGRGATGTRRPARSDTGSERSNGSPTSSRSTRSRPEPSSSRDSGANRRRPVARQPPLRDRRRPRVEDRRRRLRGRLGLAHARRSPRHPRRRRPRAWARGARSVRRRDRGLSPSHEESPAHVSSRTCTPRLRPTRGAAVAMR